MKKIYPIDNFSNFATPHIDLPISRGVIESILPSDNNENHFLISGWLLLPDQPMDTIELFIDNKYIETYKLIERQDVQQAFSQISHSLISGFIIPKLNIKYIREICNTSIDDNTNNNLKHVDDYPLAKISLIGCWQGKRVAILVGFTYRDLQLINIFPTPPKDYMARVVNTTNSYFFKLGSIQTFGQFMEVACKHIDFNCVQRILDWGCGCGRLTMHFLSIIHELEVFGCDIDPLAIEWSNNNIKSDVFSVINPFPPIEYVSDSFDVIFSYSVFTHLSSDIQHSWLKEMKRILKPNGLLIATTHGEFAFEFAFPSKRTEFLVKGIVDNFLDPVLDKIAPKDYYRATYQTKKYTLREFGKYFDIVDYIDRGAMNFQDLVIMRKT